MASKELVPFLTRMQVSKSNRKGKSKRADEHRREDVTNACIP